MTTELLERLDLGPLGEFRPGNQHTDISVPSLRVDPAFIHTDPPVPILYSHDPLLLIAFDQAIANTGWAVLHFDSSNIVEIRGIGTIKTRTEGELTSWADTLDRSTRLATDIEKLLIQWQPNLVVHEMPPVGKGPFVRRSESSVVAATAVRITASSLSLPVEHVGANKAKKHLTGNAKAKKDEVKGAIKARIEHGSIIEVFETGRYNEHIWDAIALGITYGELR